MLYAAWLVVGAPPPSERSRPLRPPAISLFADPQQDRLADSTAQQAGLVADSTAQQEESTPRDKPPVTPQKAPAPQKVAPQEASSPAVQSQWVSRWTPHMLSDLYKHGKPSNDVSQAGLMSMPSTIPRTGMSSGSRAIKTRGVSSSTDTGRPRSSTPSSPTRGRRAASSCIQPSLGTRCCVRGRWTLLPTTLVAGDLTRTTRSTNRMSSRTCWTSR